MKRNNLPQGWDVQKLERVRVHYEEQTEEEAVAEDEAAFADRTQTVMQIPLELVPVVREMLAKYYGDHRVPA